MLICKKALEELKKICDPPGTAPEDCICLEPCSSDPGIQKRYNKARKVFNTRFDFKPPLIIQVRDTAEVSRIVNFVQNYEKPIPITVKSGGHDHEGESVATGKVLIDFSQMHQIRSRETNIELEKADRAMDAKAIVAVQPGAVFRDIKKFLDLNGLGLAHGTCQTVGIAGYTMGGGWGPWTRRYGMGCERLIGATIVLGNGEIRYLGISALDDTNPDVETSVKGEALLEENNRLLKAIRGGGGLSYGIVTDFYFLAFELPDEAISFTINPEKLPILADIPAFYIIKTWEQMIAPTNNPELIGTNLKVVAKAVDSEDKIDPYAVLDWQFNGHFGGTCEELRAMLERWRVYVIEQIILHVGRIRCGSIEIIIDKFNKQFDAFIKEEFKDSCNSNYDKSQGYPLYFERWDQHGARLTLEDDCPAPHKISSKMPTPRWNDHSREQLVCSLQSPLLKSPEETNLSTYITLGAISGEYYLKKRLGEVPDVPTSFPYEDSPFTIQYQAWWNMTTEGEGCELSEEQEERLTPTRFEKNRAMDWIETARNYRIDHTHGSFISFKDDSIPTFQYFSQFYEPLIETKLEVSQDKHCLFQSRKTIL